MALLFYSTFSKNLLQHTHIHNINSQRFFVHEDTVSRPKISLLHVSQIVQTNDKNSITYCSNIDRILVSWKRQRGRLWNMSCIENLNIHDWPFRFRLPSEVHVLLSLMDCLQSVICLLHSILVFKNSSWQLLSLCQHSKVC